MNERNQSRPGGARQASQDRLPPYSEEAEQGVLGCCFLAPECLKTCLEWFRGEQPFYEVRHGALFAVMVELDGENKSLDLILLGSLLKDRGQWEAVGGMAYVAGLADRVPSAANLESYLEIVWEKFLARQLLQRNAEVSRAVLEGNGVSEAVLARADRLGVEFQQLVQRGRISPQYLKRAQDFGEEFFQYFFGGLNGAPGLELPIAFPMKVRRGEVSLVSGDDGSGKSTLLNYFAIHLAAALEPPKGGTTNPEKVVIASMEMPAAQTLYLLAAQLLGSKYLPDTEEGHRRSGAAMIWLNQHFLFYDFLGIADWRDILDTFAYAAEKEGATIGIIDSVMRAGIMDDDYATQGLAAATIGNFAQQKGMHIFEVIHENKGDGKGKAKARGSKLWSANANNFLQVKRNEEKGEKAGRLQWEIEQERGRKNPNEDLLSKNGQELEKLKRDWDCELVLRKQRYPGTQQNASKRFWYDANCFQFRGHFEDAPVNWLERWRRRGHHGGTEGTERK